MTGCHPERSEGSRRRCATGAEILRSAQDDIRAIPCPPWPIRAGILGIITFYTLFAALYATRTPAWQVPDEPAHFNYVRALADSGAFPVLQTGDYDGPYLETLKARHFPPELSVEPVRYESYQPPLYYAFL